MCTENEKFEKTVIKHIWFDYLETVEDIRHTPKYQKLYERRKETIERVFADAKEKHAMRYTPYRGLTQVTNWVRLKFAAMNLKKYAIHKENERKRREKSSIDSFILDFFQNFFHKNAKPGIRCYWITGFSTGWESLQFWQASGLRTRRFWTRLCLKVKYIFRDRSDECDVPKYVLQAIVDDMHSDIRAFFNPKKANASLRSGKHSRKRNRIRKKKAVYDYLLWFDVMLKKYFLS